MNIHGRRWFRTSVMGNNPLPESSERDFLRFRKGRPVGAGLVPPEYPPCIAETIGRPLRLPCVTNHERAET
jgi:hypothetical protein